MFNKDTRKGLSLGSIVALVSSLLVFGVSAPAQADETKPVIGPVAGTSYTMLITEEFQLKTRLGSSMDTALISKLRYQVEKTGGLNGNALSISAQKSLGQLSALSLSNWTASFNQNFASFSSMVNTATVSVVTPPASELGNDHDNVLAIYPWSGSPSANSITSKSASITVHVTAFIDSNLNGSLDVGEPAATRVTVTFVPWSSLGATVAVAQMGAGATTMTLSSVIPDTVNREQLTGSFVISGYGGVQAGATLLTTTTKSAAITAGELSQKATNFVSHSAATSVPLGATSYAAYLFYNPAGGTTLNQNNQIATATITSTTETVDDFSIAPVVGANVSHDFKARPNQTYTIRVAALTNSASVSGAVLSVAMTGTTLAIGSKEISVNGASSTTSYPTALSITTGTDGYASFTVRTIGFVNEDFITFTVTRNLVAAESLTLRTYDPVYTVVNDYERYLVAPAGSAVLSYTVEDQWGEPSARVDQRLIVTRATTTGFNYTETVSYVAVSAGVASFTYVPQPTTASGSTEVTVGLQRLNSNNGVYTTDSGSNTVTTYINVTAATNAFSTGLAVSYAASVSYFPNTVSWATVTAKVANSGSAVVVTGDSLIFRASTTLTTTTSGTITVRADNSGTYTFQVASLRAGSKTMTLTNGTATTTSLLVVAAAASNNGRTIAWDTSTIEAGKTRVITGTLTDANGNPVDTTGQGTLAEDSGTASLVISYTGTAGIVVGTVPSETDADGKFRISVLTSAADSGTLTITAVYMPQGASTVAANRITSVQAVSVAPASAPEVNAVIGSFNGRWAVRVENAKGSVVSVKAGNRWVKFTSLNNNYLFSRKSVVGRTIAVSVWVDGELQNSQTITIK